jgi:D-3-phosphoglycerate dehydrogenase/C-terminal binding protein
MIGKAELGRLKLGAILVNTSRGEVMSQRALIEALRSGQISQAGLDVLEGEPEVPHELKSSSQVLMTAHSAFYSDSSLKELRRKAALAAVRLLRGETEPNIINNVPSIANFKDCQLLVDAAE